MPTPADNPLTQEHHWLDESASLGAVDAVRLEGKPSNLWIDAWRYLRTRPTFWISAVMIAGIVFVAIFPGVVTPLPPNNDCQLSLSNSPPSSEHLLGTTKQGCDVLSRIAHGASTSVSVGFIVVIITAALGIVFGAIAGYYGGVVDSVLSRVGDMFFAIPYILAAVVVMSVLSQYRSIWTISLAIGMFAWPQIARVLRAEILRVKNADYVLAAEAIGVSRLTILIRHVLPNSLAPVVVISTVSLAAAIVAEATLSFLGVGLGGAVMSWGNDITEAQQSLRTDPMVLVYPSVALSVTVLSFILMGEVVRDALDPKARSRR